MRQNRTIQALWVGLGAVSSFALTIVSAMVLSRHLPKEEYGSYRQILYIYNCLLVIFSVGLPKVLSYYLPRYSLEEGKSVVYKVTRVLFFIGLLFSALLFFGAGIIAKLLKNEALELGLRHFSAVPIFMLPTLGIEGIFSSYGKTIFIAIYNVCTKVLILSCIVLPVTLFNGNMLSAINGWVFVSLFCFLMGLYLKKIPFKGIVSKKTTLTYKEMASFTLPILSATLCGVAIKFADQFYISRYFGSKAFAEFANGFMDLPLVAMVTSATSTVLAPVFSKMIHDKSEVASLILVWRNAFVKSAYIIIPVVIYCFINADEIIVFLFSAKYTASAAYFKIALLLNFFNIIIFTPLLLSIGATKFYFQLHFFSAIAIWCIDYLVILLVHSPLAIAACSVLVSISRILIALKFISTKVDAGYFDFIPVKEILKITLHSMLVLIGVQFLVNKTILATNDLYFLVSSYVVFYLILIASGKYFNLNYWAFLVPIFRKLRVISKYKNL
jgi:O-antigen/teichoic acid export membrane protein